MRKNYFIGCLLGMICLCGTGGNVSAGTQPAKDAEIAAETLNVTVTDAQTADAQPQQTMAPDILQADYAELYINALKQCGYMKQRLEAGSFLAVSLPSYPVLEEE